MKIINSLSKDFYVKCQITMILSFSYLTKPVLRCYQELYRRAREESESIQRLYCYQTDHIPSTPDDHPFNIFQRSWIFHNFYDKYKHLSTVVMIFILVKSILPIEWFVSLFEPTIATHCFLPGRILMVGSIPTIYVILCSAAHLYWRFEKIFINPAYRLDLVTFMLQKDEDLERIYNISKKKLHKEDDLAPIDRCLLSIMYYPVNCGRRTFYRLRPNRTREARKELASQLARQTIICIVFMFALIFSAGPLITYSVVNNIDYVRDYPTCYRSLDERYLKNEFTSFSVTLKNHKLLINLFEAVENIVFWVDSAIAITFATSLVFLLNYDLLLYWRCLNQRLGHLLHYLRARHRFAGSAGGGEFGYAEEEDKLEFMSQLQFYDANCEEPSYEIHCLASDFFRQIRCVDIYMSVFIRLVVLLWLAHSASLSYCNLVEKPEKMLSLQSFQFIAIALLPFAIYTLILNHKTLRTYQKICSLVALIDTRYKKNYMQLLNYYAGRSWATYTLFDHPYRPTTLLTLIGWSFSCGVIADNLTRSVKAFRQKNLNEF